MKRKNILIISHDKIGDSMAGPGIRYHYMAQELSRHFDVTVGFFDPSYLPNKKFKKNYEVTHIHAPDFFKTFIEFETVIALWLSREMIDFCNEKSIFIVFDVYAPVPVENLALTMFNNKKIKPEDEFSYDQTIEMYKYFFAKGDLFLFSNRRQLDFWTGYVFGSNLVTLNSYEKRPFYERFLYAPMGINTKIKLQHTNKVMRNKLPGITNTDKILLWTGGIWNWFDGKVLIKAMALINKERPDIKLVFFGTKHPNPNVPEMKESKDTKELAKSLGLLGKSVHIQEGWVDYKDRQNYLIEADVAVSTCKLSIESEFSHRTRVLDHILAELPTISTVGDYFTDDVIEQKKIGIAVLPNNENELAKAILKILEQEKYDKFKTNIQEVRHQYDWEETLKYLVEFLLSNPEKLTILPSTKNKNLLPNNKLINKAKRVLPKPLKKLLVKLYKYAR